MKNKIVVKTSGTQIRVNSIVIGVTSISKIVKKTQYMGYIFFCLTNTPIVYNSGSQIDTLDEGKYRIYKRCRKLI